MQWLLPSATGWRSPEVVQERNLHDTSFPQLAIHLAWAFYLVQKTLPLEAPHPFVFKTLLMHHF